MFRTISLPPSPSVTAPDGSDVRILPLLNGGSMTHFELAAYRVIAPSYLAASLRIQENKK